MKYIVKEFIAATGAPWNQAVVLSVEPRHVDHQIARQHVRAMRDGEQVISCQVYDDKLSARAAANMVNQAFDTKLKAWNKLMAHV